MNHDIDPTTEERLRSALQDEAGLLPPPPQATPPHLADALPSLATTSGPVVTSYDDFYAAHRDELYRALAVSLADRDLATEAVDRALGNAFTAWRRHARLADPRTRVFRSGFEWARKRQSKTRGGVSGFRLEWETDETRADVVSALRSLAPEQRAVLVLRHYLGWGPAEVADALGTTPEAVASRDAKATASVATALAVPNGEAAAMIPPAVLSDANGLAAPISRLDSTKTRGWARRGMAALGGAAAVVVLVGGVAIGINAFSGEDTPPGIEVSGTNGNGTSGTTGTSLVTNLADATVLADLEWTRIPLGSGDGEINQVAYGENGFIAIGNDWQNGRSLAFVSEDALAWEQIEPPMDTNNGWIASIQTGPFGYMAVGSVYDNFGGGNQAFVWMSEDGYVWEETELVSADREEVAGVTVQWYTDVYNIAAADGKFIAVGSQWADIGDPERFFADGLPDDVELWWGWDIDTTDPENPILNVYDEEGGGETRSFTFEELGLDPAIASIIWSNRPLLWTSDDGIDWSEGQPLEAFGPDAGIGRIAAGPNGFIATVWQRFGQALYFSPDGTAWERVELPRGSQVNDVAVGGGRYVAVGTSGGNGAVFTSTDGVTWETTTSEVLQADYIERIAAGPAGFVVVAQGRGGGGVQNMPPAVIDTGTVSVEMYQDGSFVVYDAESGNAMFELYGDEVEFTGNGDITIKDPDTGDLIATLTSSEVEQAWEEVWRSFEGEAIPVEPGMTGPRILVSSDGVEWVELDTAAAFGTGFYPYAIALGPDAIVLTGWQEGGGFGFEQAPRPSVWVGLAP